ncbi:MAG: TauD/TfdA family dioxygenase [Gammaproteobacteria bacterium]|nr:TauD/TfdA family dioxygenase [Gammaproteobacteria bacterium]MBU1624980.1 TauD/TfdA family dioxygenase [Gammaproteobacteria bacterium]MBU1981240.1 TauD/TfdA family dioxygenase [Gammaproteobacteria bacterium]
MNNPFDLADDSSFQRWRDAKLASAPCTAEDLIVEVKDPRALNASEHAALADRIRRCNMAIYASPMLEEDSNILRKLGEQFGLNNLDANWLAGEDGVSSIRVFDGGTRKHYIPYTDKPIKWHTDGYYNPPERQIRAMVLHCVRDAISGGENRLMDHELCYLLLREQDPAHIKALMQPDVMTIPERVDENDGVRPAQSGPVFSTDADGNLHMRYTARTRSIEWKQDDATQAAVAALEALLASDVPQVFNTTMQPGMGLLCNNVLHDRSAFTDDSQHPRLLYRARYLDRISLA